MPFKRTILTACPMCGADVFSAPKERHTYCSRTCEAQGRTTYRTYSRASVSDRFWLRVQKSPGCWLATGAHHSSGYRTMTVPQALGKEKSVRFNHIAWWLATGQWPPDGMFICHNCPGGDNTACVRNDEIGIYVVRGITYERRGHLWLGTPAANHQDMVDKGTIGRGARHGMAKLTEQDIKDIRSRLGKDTQRVIAADKGVCLTTIKNIASGKTWGHVQ